MAVIAQPGGLHPKMADIVESVLAKIEKVGGDIGQHKPRWLCQCTWKDSNNNTMYLD
ncbi:hypothetical protein L208DRAFT_1323711 [Tricholoma matsutake]|nr:hypothetical protein L208DRAFT_1323711 [Tricholoma matsutake 945]